MALTPRLDVDTLDELGARAALRAGRRLSAGCDGRRLTYAYRNADGIEIRDSNVRTCGCGRRARFELRYAGDIKQSVIACGNCDAVALWPEFV